MIKDLFQSKSKIRQHKSWQIMRMDICTQTSLTGKISLIEQAVKTSGLIFTGSKCIHMDNTLNSSEPFLVINFVRESSENEINLSKAEGKNFFQANDRITAWECIAKNTLTVPCFCIWALLRHI